MVMSKGESLKSKFKMSYSILFNSLSSQSIELDDIIKKSFGEDMNYTEIKNLKVQREKAQEELDNVKIKCEFVDIEEAIPVFHSRHRLMICMNSLVDSTAEKHSFGHSDSLSLPGSSMIRLQICGCADLRL
eukprot:GABU01004850.1.p2 GENE.GABU01004850.1~~GABU01004850.1.p2  ORF type:complete len:144 (-),score=42.92 GABU01004850.1:499-891(-)